MADDARAELAALAALTAEHLRHEMDVGNAYLPRVSVSAVAESAVAESAAESAVAESAAGSVAVPENAQGRLARLRVLADEAASCTRCSLHEGRTKSVFARGSDTASLVFVGEGPGYHEDQSGAPFVGKAGQLLDKMVGAMGLDREEIYVCNVVKCRPPDNRTPSAAEAEACVPFLKEQLALVAPTILVALGRHAAENLGVAKPGRAWRGRWGTYEGVRVMPTYHPAYLLRNPENKRVVWQDLQAVVKAMGRELPQRS